MLCFLVASHESAERAAALSKLAQGAGFSVTLVADLDQLRTMKLYLDAARALVLVPDSSPDNTLAEVAIRFAEDEGHRAYSIYIAETFDAIAYKRLLKTQAGEWTRWGSLQQEVADAAKRFASTTSPSHANIVSFFPSKGGVGTTTVAIEAALHLASLRKRVRIALMDMNRNGGTLADSLDVEPRFDLHEISNRPDRLDNQLIDVFKTRYSDQLDVFATAPSTTPNESAVDPKMIFAVLDLLATRYDVIFLDIPNERQPWTNTILQGSDAIVLLGSTTIPALKQLSSKLAQLDQIEFDRAKLVVVVNQCETGLMNRIIRRDEIGRALPGRRVFFVREDLDAVRTAQNAGRPVTEMASGSRFSKDIRRLAEWIDASLANHMRRG